MVKTSNNTYIVTQDEINGIIEHTVLATLGNLKGHPIFTNEVLTADQVRKELDIGKTTFHEKCLKGKHAIPFVGGPRTRRINRSDFETWKKEHWGKY